MDLAQALNATMVQAAIEAVPRTIIPVSPRNESPSTTKPALTVETKAAPKKQGISIKREMTKHFGKEHKDLHVPKSVIKEDVLHDVGIKKMEKTAKEDVIPIEKQENEPVKFIKQIDGIELDIYDYFDLSPSNIRKDELSKLTKIQEWSKGDIAKIDKVRRSLGKSKVGYEGLIDLYNYIRVRELR